MNLLDVIAFCVMAGYQEMNWYSCYHRCAVKDAYLFGVNYEVAKSQHTHAERLLQLLRDSREKYGESLTKEQRFELDIIISWQYHRESSWRNLRDALNPSESFASRRWYIDKLREDLAILGIGVGELWKLKRMPSPVFGD